MVCSDCEWYTIFEIRGEFSEHKTEFMTWLRICTDFDPATFVPIISTRRMGPRCTYIRLLTLN